MTGNGPWPGARTPPAADRPPGAGTQPGPGTLPAPHLLTEVGRIPLARPVTTVGRGGGCDVRLAHPSVSVLHAELVRRGPYVYVADLGLSLSGTTVNGRPVTRRLLADGDIICFGQARCEAGGIPAEPAAETTFQPVPQLTRRELEILDELCRPALSPDPFSQPASVAQMAAALTVTPAAIKQHILRLFAKLGIPEGPNRRTRLANTAVALGLTRPAALAPPGAAVPAPSPAAPVL
jgi:hypothetical protein